MCIALCAITISTLKIIHTLYPCNITPFSLDLRTQNPTLDLVIAERRCNKEGVKHCSGGGGVGVEGGPKPQTGENREYIYIKGEGMIKLCCFV